MNSTEAFVDHRGASEKKLRSTASSFVVTNRTKSFKNDFAETYNDAKKQSNVYQLASSIYAKDLKGQFVISPKRPLSLKTLNPQKRVQINLNPQLIQASSKQIKRLSKSVTPIQSTLLQNFSRRTIMLVDYRKSIDELNSQKQKTLRKISELKRKIIFEKKLKSKLVLKSEKHLNSAQQSLDYSARMKRHSSRNKQCKDADEQQCKNLQSYVQITDNRSVQTIEAINFQRKLIECLVSQVGMLKQKSMSSNQQLNQLKSKLSIGLKVMKNNSNTIKHLQSQKADLLLFINNEIQQNKVPK